MSILFSIIGFIILGLIIRSFCNDSSVKDKPKSITSWLIQLIISLIVGFVIWSVIPEKCKRGSDREYDGRWYQE